MTMECMGRQALACFVGTTESEHKGYFYSTDLQIKIISNGPVPILFELWIIVIISDYATIQHQKYQ